MSGTDFIRGEFESMKFFDQREGYYESLETIKGLNYSFEDLIHYFPAFTGHLTLARFLSLFECYQKTLGIAGHMAEIGVYKGACTLLFAKLAQLYEANTLTQVHGFDWFRGTASLSEDEKKHLIEGTYHEPKERLEALIAAQKLGHLIKLHDMDMSSDAVDNFFGSYQHLQFKLILFDAGVYSVVSKSLPYFWERLTVGGVVIFDQFNFDAAPGEARAVREVLGGAVIRTFPNGWMPTAYVIKV